jgi:hypothetical protein
MPNVFDQFDQADQEQGSNPFDQFDAPKGKPELNEGIFPELDDPNSPLYGQRHGGSFVTGIVDGLKRAITLPREVYEGKVDLNTPEGQDRAAEAAITLAPSAPSGLVRFAPKSAPVVDVLPKAGGEVARAANELGVSIPRGVATDSKPLQAAYQRGRQVPGATGVIDQSLDNFYRGVEGKVDEVAATAAGGTLKDKAELGASVRASVERAIEKQEAASDEAFKIMRRAIDPDKRVNALTNEVGEAINKVVADRSAAGEAPIPKRAEAAFKILQDPEGVSFNALQRARSQVGRAIKWEEAQGGFDAADLKQVYGALTQAMDNAVRQSAKTAPESAVKLWKAADVRFAKMADENKVLGSVLRKDADEGLVSSIVGMASAKGGNARKLDQVLREIGPEAKGELAGFVVQGLGRGRDGNFSALAFTNNWKQLSGTGKAQLFSDPNVRNTLENIATITERMAEVQKKFANSSNTAGAVGHGALGAGMLADPITTLATIAGANGIARFLSAPAAAKAAKDYAKAWRMHSLRPNPATLKALEQARSRLLEAAAKGGALYRSGSTSGQASIAP